MLFVVSSVTIVAAATFYVTNVRTDSPADAQQAPLDGPDLRPSNDPDLADREPELSRGKGQARGPDAAPTATVTISGPLVNDRRQPDPVDPPQSGDGTYGVVPGGAQPPDRTSGEVVPYIVEVEDGLPFDADDFAADVHTILNDERGWGSDGSMRFERVDDGPVDIRVSLSSADLTDDQCYPLLTRGKVSCWNGSRAVINAERWGLGAKTFGDDIRSYREYLINHEFGHGLGHAHESCPADGELAPVMVQQTKSLEGCKPNAWPSPDSD